MWYKFFITDLAVTLFSRTTVYLILIFSLITFAGLYIGQARYGEVQLLSDGSGDVVRITDTASFLDRMENILDRAFKSYHQIDDQRWGYLFIFSKLVEFWPLGTAIGLIIYGYFFLTRERNAGITRTLLASLIRVTDYYVAKMLSGVAYWGIFLYFYSFLLVVVCYFTGGLSRPLFQGIMAGVFLLWIYVCLLWAGYLGLSCTLKNYRRVGYVVLFLVLIFSFIVPQCIRLISEASLVQSPPVPYLLDYSWTITSSGEAAKTGDEVEKNLSLENLRLYRQQTIDYFTKGTTLENRLIYASPVLMVEKTLKAYFRPEMLNFQSFLNGQWRKPTFSRVLVLGLHRFLYLFILTCVIFLFTGIYLKRCEIGLE